MPEFEYTARDTSGKIITETFSASSTDEAASILRAQKYQILKLTEKKQSKHQPAKIIGGVSTVEKANLCRYLSTMINAGLPLIEAVVAINRDTKSKALKAILADVGVSLQQGETLSATFAKYPHVFDKIFTTIVEAGEKSGTLGNSFKYLQDQLMSNYTLTQKVKGALIYPAVIISAMLGVGIILIVFVVPQIAQVFLKSSFPVPATTTAILRAGLALNQNLPLIGIGLAILILILIISIRSARGKRILVNGLKRVPGVSKLFEKLDLTRFSRILATLMKSGVPITQSLEVSTTTLSQPKFKPLRFALVEGIKKGESISTILRRYQKLIPRMLISMVSTGEKTGSLDKILFDVAHFFEEELEDEIKSFTAILEPVIMLFIGVGVGGMVLAIIAPIYSLVASLQQIQ